MSMRARKLNRRHLRNCALIVLVVLSGTLVGTQQDARPTAHVAEPELRAIGSYRDHAMVATVNIQGGRNPNNHEESNVTKWFNEDIARIGLDNTIQSRVMARGSYLHGLGLQEVCRNHWLDVVYERTVWQAIDASNPWALSERIKPTIDSGLSGGCGGWYGISTLIRGQVIGSGSGFYPRRPDTQLRAWTCYRTYVILCNTHLEYKEPTNNNQINNYRGIVTYTSAQATSVSAFAVGDLNTEPWDYSDLWRPAFAYDGYLESDLNCCEATIDRGVTIDYVFRSRPASFTYDAYVSPWSRTDHHWKQGYW